MSADELKQKFSAAHVRAAQDTQLEELRSLGKWKDAQELVEQMEGREPRRGQIVRIDFARARG